MEILGMEYIYHHQYVLCKANTARDVREILVYGRIIKVMTPCHTTDDV